MKQTNILFVLAIFIGAVLSSCSSSSNFTKRKYFNFKQDQKEFARATPNKPAAESNELAAEEAIAVNETIAPAEAQPVAEPSKEAVKPSKKAIAKKEAVVTEQNAPALGFNTEKLSLGERMVLKQAKKIAEKQNNNSGSDVPMILLVLLAIFIPPLAVFLVDGIGTPFWIDLILTLLFFLPGIIYALYIVFTR